MHWNYLSPHLDDAALSCGGLIWEQTNAGEQASVWTICAGDPPDGPLSAFAEQLHARWETGAQAGARRRAEDLASCKQMGASALHLPVPDCIYRQAGRNYLLAAQTVAGESGPAGAYLYASREAIFGPLDPAEAPLIEQLRAYLRRRLPAEAGLVCPLAVGNHVDHQLTRAAAEALGRPLWYYADYPYIAENTGALEELEQAGWQKHVVRISAPGQAAWEAAVAAHQSQISTFWPDLAAMQAGLQAYANRLGGLALWRRPPPGQK